MWATRSVDDTQKNPSRTIFGLAIRLVICEVGSLLDDSAILLLQDNSIVRYSYPSIFPTVIVPSANTFINQPRGIVVDKQGIIYVSNSGASTVVRIYPNGTMAIWIFTSQGVLNQPGPMAFDSTWSNLYIANRAGGNLIKVVMATNVISNPLAFGTYISVPQSLSYGWNPSTDQYLYVAPGFGGYSNYEVRFGQLPSTFTYQYWGTTYWCAGVLTDRLNGPNTEYCAGANTVAGVSSSQIVQTTAQGVGGTVWATYGCNPTQTVWDPFGNMWMVGSQGICHVLSGLNVTCNPPVGTALAFNRNATCTVVPFWIYPGATVVYNVLRAGTGGGQVTVGSMTFKDFTPQTFTYTSMSPVGSADLTFNPVATLQYFNYVPPPLFSFPTSADQIIVRCIQYGNGTIYWLQNITCYLAPTATPINGLVTVTPTFWTSTQGGTFQTLGGTTQWNFFSTIPQNFTLTAPAAGSGDMVLSYAISGPDQLQYALMPGNSFTLAPPVQITMTCNPGPYLSNTRVTTCTLTPNAAPQFKQLTVLLTKSGVSGALNVSTAGFGTGVFNVPSLFFTTAAPQNFTFQANAYGPITLYATPAGIDGGQYLAPIPVQLQVTNCTVTVTCDPVNGSSLRYNQNSTCIVFPNCVPPTGSFTVLISLTGAGVAFPPSMTFFANVSQTFVYTAPMQAANPVISFPMTGLDSGAFVQAAPFQWTVGQSLYTGRAASLFGVCIYMRLSLIFVLCTCCCLDVWSTWVSQTVPGPVPQCIGFDPSVNSGPGIGQTLMYVGYSVSQSGQECPRACVALQLCCLQQCSSDHLHHANCIALCVAFLWAGQFHPAILLSEHLASSCDLLSAGSDFRHSGSERHHRRFVGTSVHCQRWSQHHLAHYA
jgi:hypothetical protein